VSVGLHMDGAGFRASMTEFEGEIYRAAVEALTDGVDAAARDAFSTNAYRNKTWKLRSSTRASVNKFEFTGGLENKTKYASFVEFGTRPHVIQARRKPLLRFFWTRHGVWFSGKKVNHPGTSPRLFFKHAGQVGGEVFERELVRRLDQLTSQFNSAA
jgi:hypothetical protein